MDYTYPSVFFSYLVFFLFLFVALYFFFRSFRDGYWGAESEDVKYQVFADEESNDGKRAS
ncbi:MAG: hypothetical protein HY820_08815 [Acidobacteria bacterium]|nr:hypothetical protein [Acidobacteriota bacterium]